MISTKSLLLFFFIQHANGACVQVCANVCVEGWGNSQQNLPSLYTRRYVSLSVRPSVSISPFFSSRACVSLTVHGSRSAALSHFWTNSLLQDVVGKMRVLGWNARSVRYKSRNTCRWHMARWSLLITAILSPNLWTLLMNNNNNNNNNKYYYIYYYYLYRYYLYYYY